MSSRLENRKLLRYLKTLFSPLSSTIFWSRAIDFSLFILGVYHKEVARFIKGLATTEAGSTWIDMSDAWLVFSFGLVLFIGKTVILGLIANDQRQYYSFANEILESMVKKVFPDLQTKVIATIYIENENSTKLEMVARFGEQVSGSSWEIDKNSPRHCKGVAANVWSKQEVHAASGIPKCSEILMLPHEERVEIADSLCMSVKELTEWVKKKGRIPRSIMADVILYNNSARKGVLVIHSDVEDIELPNPETLREYLIKLSIALPLINNILEME